MNPRVVQFQGGREPRPAPGFQRKRVAFRPDGGEVVSVWADVKADGAGATVRLLYDYEDFAPAAGCPVDWDGGAFKVKSADGRTVACEPEGGGT